MLVIPAIDIIAGKCVRLTRGDYSSKKIYADDPLKVARKFQREGATMLHIVDLDGAKSGNPVNMKTIVKIKKTTGLPMQVGGGIRNLSTIKTYLEAGIERVIVSTVALKNPEFLAMILKKYGNEHIVVSLDMRKNQLASDGWLETATYELDEFLKKLRDTGITEVIVTDILKDGTLTVPNFEMLQRIQRAGFQVIAAGGISSNESLRTLQQMKLKGAIIGKALYEGVINIPSALETVNGTSGLSKRIIPCLDVKNGRVVKGIKFENLRDSGDPVELGKRYAAEGADELVFLDITASKEKRQTIIETVRNVAAEIFIPFTVGGGVNSAADIRNLLRAGADKVAINTAAVLNPQLIKDAAAAFGRQCIVVAIDVKKVGRRNKVFIKGGNEETALEALPWAQQVAKLGAGEILLTSMDRDGTKKGFDVQLLQKISSKINIPIIASGGAGKPEDFEKAFKIGNADAALAASLFHNRELSIHKLKKYLSARHIPIRL